MKCMPIYDCGTFPIRLAGMRPFQQSAFNNNVRQKLLLKANIVVTAKNLLRLKARVREITSRKRGISLDRMVSELSRYLRGWMGYFGLSSTKRI